MLKKYLLLLTIIFTLLSLSNIAFAVTKSRTHTAIDQILASTQDDLNVGIIIEDPANGKILFQRNADRLFTPASNMKLFTAYAALNTLGPTYTFQTAIYADTTHLENGVLHDNVYLQFTGDPSFSSLQLDALVKALAQAGIQKIEGQFIIVNDAVSQNGFGPGWMWDDGNYCYGEAANGMVVDHNCFTLNILPATKIGESAIFQITHTAAPFIISNQVITANVTENCHIVIKSNEANNYAVQGCINQNANNSTATDGIDIAVRNVNLYVTQLIKKSLENNHIVLMGNIQFGKLNTVAKPLLAIQSDKLPQILSTMLKNSDDLYANALFMRMGQISFGGMGTWQKGQKALQNNMQTKLGIDPKTWMMVDGAGASRYNLVTPKQILTMLNAIYKDPRFSSIFIPALSISGTDGTLQDRMTALSIKGRVMAKTGSMTGVSSLSGYIKTAHNRTLIFVILMNNFLGPEDNYRSMQDRICEYLVRDA